MYLIHASKYYPGLVAVFGPIQPFNSRFSCIKGVYVVIRLLGMLSGGLKHAFRMFVVVPRHHPACPGDASARIFSRSEYI